MEKMEGIAMNQGELYYELSEMERKLQQELEVIKRLKEKAVSKKAIVDEMLSTDKPFDGASVRVLPAKRGVITPEQQERTLIGTCLDVLRDSGRELRLYEICDLVGKAGYVKPPNVKYGWASVCTSLRSLASKGRVEITKEGKNNIYKYVSQSKDGSSQLGKRKSCVKRKYLPDMLIGILNSENRPMRVREIASKVTLRAPNTPISSIYSCLGLLAEQRKIKRHHLDSFHICFANLNVKIV